MNRYSKENSYTKISFGKFKYENQSSKVHRFIPTDITTSKDKKTFFQKIIDGLKAIVNVFKKLYSASELFK
ncbi:MAG: hypothetical protein PHE67_14040 [Campylobacterales bacterium]|nr:hypothetical protein [Campylobacterales bacterium]